jgi:hypothetical protein
MTNENENADQQHHETEVESEAEETRPTSTKCKAAGQLNRLSKILGKSGYKFDASLGRIVINRECFPECHHLVPITRLTRDPTTTHGLIAPSGLAEKWTAEGRKAQSAEIIGYCVLEKGACGANLAVRHLSNNEVQVQTSNDSEYNSFKSNGFVTTAKTAPTFYVWGSSDQLTPPARSPVEDKTSVLTRLWKLNLYRYSIDPQEQEILDKAWYKYDGIMGRIVTNKADMPDCPDLVPITRINHRTIHFISADAAFVSRNSNAGGGWENAGVIGYGVLTKGKCGATVPVRHVADLPQFQVTNDAEHAIYKQYGWIDHSVPIFYIWEA